MENTENKATDFKTINSSLNELTAGQSQTLGTISSLATITLNGVEYVRKADAPQGANVIAIAQRNWIFVGRKGATEDGRLRLTEASVVRSWRNGRGIGGLAKDAYRHEYNLDWVGTVEFADGGVIAEISAEW
jgi:hypothetical protein